MGRYKPSFSDQELLNFVKAHPASTASKLVERFNVTRQDIHHRMNKLIKKGFIMADVGARRRATLFYVTKNQPWRTKIHDK